MSSTLNHFTVYRISLCLLPVTPFLPYFSLLVLQLFLVASDCTSDCDFFGPMCVASQGTSLEWDTEIYVEKCNYTRLLS